MLWLESYQKHLDIIINGLNSFRDEKVEPVFTRLTDCFFISVQLKHNDPDGYFYSLKYLIILLSLISLSSITLAKRPLRGAISLGLGIKLTTGEIISSAHVKAHNLEHDNALYPRIIIDPEIFEPNLYTYKPNGMSKKEQDQLQSSLDNLFLELLRQFNDEYFFVHLFNSKLLSGLLTKEHSEDFLDKIINPLDETIQTNLANLLNKERTKTDDKNLKKWQWLASYWNLYKDDYLKLVENIKNTQRTSE